MDLGVGACDWGSSVSRRRWSTDVQEAARLPGLMGYRLLGRIRPSVLSRRQLRLARESGISSPAFHLSFDCDTPADSRVVLRLDSLLSDMGIHPSYAVPGEILEADPETYRELLRRGRVLMNHGYRTHTRILPDGTYDSTVFYSRLSVSEVREDIFRGHMAFVDLLGMGPAGFRTPHFGDFQSPSELLVIHETLRELGYAFSSSTGPYFGFLHGPVRSDRGIHEIPLSSCPEWPTGLLDTYGFLRAGIPGQTSEAYLRQLRLIAGGLSKGSILWVNTYGDPAHVYDWQDYFTVMQLLAPYSVPSPFSPEWKAS